MHCRSSLVLSMAIGFLTVCSFGCSSSGSETAAGSGGSSVSSGGQASTGGATGSGGQVSTSGATGTGGKVGTGGSSSTGGTAAGGTGGSGAGGTSVQGSGGATATGGRTGSGGAAGAAGSGGSSSSGGQPGTGGASNTGGNLGRDGGPTTGGSGGGTAGDGGGSTPAGQSAGCGKTSTITSSQYNNGNPISITVGTQQRRYILNIPTNYDNTKPYKFILGIHALDSNDKSVYNEKYYGLLPLSNNTVIFAAPNGVKNGAPCSGTGTGDSGCGWPSGNMPLIDAVVKQVTENFCVDMNHIYASGWSYGASMSYEIGCERPLGGPAATANWGIRAIAIYAVRQMSGSCKPSIPIGYYLSHGTNDNVLGYDGGVSLTQTYATTNGCTWATPPKASGSHICTNLTGCKTGYPVEFCSFVGGHTAYPDSGSSGSSWGPAEVWKFLSQF
jgi:poly(3-hydroxybutyrate) depolymerase